MKMINIIENNDIFYRYKMHDINIIHNGKNTIITSLSDIAHDLNRDIEELTFMFKIYLNTICKKVDNGYLFNGIHSYEILLNILRVYITSYIICNHCKNPETYYSIHSKYINIKCISCGASFKLNNNNKLTNYIITFYKKKVIENK